MKTVLDQINALGGSGRAAHEANYLQLEIARSQQILKSLLVLQNELSYISTEGAVEVTVKSRSRTVTLHVDAACGFGITRDLLDKVGKDCDKQAQDIIQHLGALADGEESTKGPLLDLLLTPIDQNGMAVPATTTPFLAEGDRCPFLPEASSKPRKVITGIV